MVMSLGPRLQAGALFFSFRTRPGRSRCAASNAKEHRIVGNNEFKRMELRQLAAADFARLSPSRQLTLLLIRRAQLSSRKAIAATAEWKRPRGGG